MEPEQNPTDNATADLDAVKVENAQLHAALAVVKEDLAAALAKNEEQAQRIADLEFMVSEDDAHDTAKGALETFIKLHGVSPLRIGVDPTGVVRLSRLDQTAALEGVVRGNRFVPK